MLIAFENADLQRRPYPPCVLAVELHIDLAVLGASCASQQTPGAARVPLIDAADVEDALPDADPAVAKRVVAPHLFDAEDAGFSSTSTHPNRLGGEAARRHRTLLAGRGQSLNVDGERGHDELGKSGNASARHRVQRILLREIKRVQLILLGENKCVLKVLNTNDEMEQKSNKTCINAQVTYVTLVHPHTKAIIIITITRTGVLWWTLRE